MSSVFCIFVGKVPMRIHWRWLRALFSKKFEVSDVFLTRSGVKGFKFGFVRFTTLEDAELAIKLFDGFKVLRSNLRVPNARERRDPQTVSSQFIGKCWKKKGSIPICRAFMLEEDCSGARLSTMERKVWVRCFGLPREFWNRQTIVNMASLWVKLSRFPHESESSLHNNACFQICTTHFYRIDDFISVVHGSNAYSVRVEEFCICHDMGLVGEGSKNQPHLPVSNKADVDILKNDIIQLESQELGDDPFGLDTIIKRLSKSGNKKSRRSGSKSSSDDSVRLSNMASKNSVIDANDRLLNDAVINPCLSVVNTRDEVESLPCRKLISDVNGLVESDSVPSLTNNAGLFGDLPPSEALVDVDKEGNSDDVFLSEMPSFVIKTVCLSLIIRMGNQINQKMFVVLEIQSIG